MKQKLQEKKMAVHQALQYYKIMSYKTFYKKVLGENYRKKVVEIIQNHLIEKQMKEKLKEK